MTAPAIPSRRVVIRPEPFGCGFDVTVQPPLDGESFDRELRTYREARGYAGGLRMVRGWPIDDQTGEGDR